jgi:hypothetical protein
MAARSLDGAASSGVMRAAGNGLSRWSLFAGLWGWVLLMHQATFDKWQHSPLGWAIVALAMGLVSFPRSLPLLAAAVCVEALYMFQCLPETANHIVFEGLVCLAWAAAMGVFVLHRLRRGVPLRRVLSLAPGEPHPLERSRTPLALGLLLVYWVSVLHKLNYDFVNPDTSCASYMYRRVSEVLPFFPKVIWAEQLSIWGTLLAEAALPVLLLSARTWQLGLVAALSFHLMLGFDPTPGIYSFTGLLFALFILVLPDAFVGAATQRLDAAARRYPRPLLIVRMAGLLVMAGILAYGVTRTDRWAFHAAFYFFLVWSAVVITGYLVTLFGMPVVGTASSAPRPSAAPVWLWALPCLVLLNGLNPYLGLRTQLSFSMFSNLRTEGGVSNHLFMPRLVSLGGYQEDLVEILETDDADLVEYPKKQLLLPYFEFRRLVSGLDDISVTYLRGGARHTFQCVAGSCNDAELAQPYSRLMGRLLYFRPVDKGPHMLCRH